MPLRTRTRTRLHAVASTSGEQEPSYGERQSEDRSLSPSSVRRRLDHPSPTTSPVEAQDASHLLNDVHEAFQRAVNAAYRGDTVSVGAETTAFNALFQAAVQNMEAARRQTSASVQRAVAAAVTAAEAAAEQRVAETAVKLAIAEARVVAAEARQAAAMARAEEAQTFPSKDLLQSNVSNRSYSQAGEEQVGPSAAAVAVDIARSLSPFYPTAETVQKTMTSTSLPALQQQSIALSSPPYPRQSTGLACYSLPSSLSSSARSPPRKTRHSAFPSSPLKTPVQAALALLTPRKVRSPRSPRKIRSPPPSSHSPQFQLESSPLGVDSIRPGKSSSSAQEKGMPETEALAPSSAALQLRLPFDGTHGISVYQRDLDTLQEGAWVNDTMIDTCLFVRRQQIQANDEKLAFSIEIFPCHFWAVLTTDGFQEHASKYAKEGDIFNKDYLVFPVNLNRSHWILAILVNPAMAIAGSVRNALASQQSETSVDTRNQELFQEDSQPSSVSSDDDRPSSPQSNTKIDLSARAALVIFDSLACGSGGAGECNSPGSHRNVFSTLKKYIFDTARRQNPDTITRPEQIRLDNLSAAVPQQSNSTDCGICLTHFFTVFFDKAFQFKSVVIPSKSASDYRWRAGEVPGLRAHWRRELAAMVKEWKKHQETQAEESKLAGAKGTSSRPKRTSRTAGRISGGSTKGVKKPS